MKSLFGGIFDFDNNGESGSIERAAEFSLLSDLMNDDQDNNCTELELSGLDPEELEFMDSDERRSVLEDAGLNPDEYDF